MAPVAEGDFVLTPDKPWSNTNSTSRNNTLLNGVDVADATRISQHVALSNLFTDPADLVAADVNRNKVVSSQDAALINQAILGRSLAFVQFNKSWRFIPTNHQLPVNATGQLLSPVPPNFWNFPETKTYTDINTDQIQDFYGIKIGDVAPNYYNISTGLRPGSALQPLIWTAFDRTLTQGEEIEVVFRSQGFTNLAAVQFALGFDPGELEYLSTVVTPGLPFNEGSFGTFTLPEGEIRFAWYSATGASVLNYTAAYRIRFRVLSGGGLLSEALSLDGEAVSPVAYASDLTPTEVRLVFLPDLPVRPREEGEEDPAPATVLYQNRPNPFVEQTTIGFMLGRDCDASLRVYDMSGRMLFENNAYRAAGYHEVDLRLESTIQRGILYYELVTPDGVLGRKMIAIDEE
jgi:hypothetical protein